ncbi:uncharacterized protein LOC112050465 [Bicyclus anynana]|uniref:Uncharacterized protein LOC112050465 n=1 Tax=Bicyclus anynana TaxID=110368 RepID=A0ABM3LT75_BICAN|nr:uncharacterized protein LOC112050465 [Bicyclus anynana]
MLLARVLNRVTEKRMFIVKYKHTSIWTAERTVKSPFDDVVIPETTIAEYVWRDLGKWSDKTAVICGVTDRKYTYLELYKQSQTFGASLRKKFKIQDGDVVTIMLSNSPEYATVTLGILAAGGVASTINPLYTVYEAQKQIASSETKLIVTSPENVNVVKEAISLSKLNIPVIIVDFDKDRPDDTVSFKELVNDPHIDKDILKGVKRSADDVSLLLYSSGTTGLPKAVELTNKNIVANCQQQNAERCKKFNDTTETNQDITLAYLPMFHCYGLSVINIHKLSVGLKLVTLPKFRPDTFLSTLEKHKFDLMYVAPPTVLFLASNHLVKSNHFEKLQNVLTGAAPLPQADVERFLSKMDHEVHFGQVYGCTEAGPVVTTTPNDHKDYSSVGFTLPNSELRIVDSEMNNMGPNELGELLIKGPNVMKGYKNNREANSQVFVDGWLRSGDLAKIDESGYVTIADRLKELIKVNAFQVPPAELESIIREHPAVFDAAVVGVPDDKTGEKPKGFVVLNKDSSTSENDIMEYVSKRVAPYKKLKEVQFIDSIPKNPSGKILRRLLIGLYEDDRSYIEDDNGTNYLISEALERGCSLDVNDVMLLTKALKGVIENRGCLSKMKHIWTVDKTVKSPFEDRVIPEATITEYLWKNLDKWSDKTAVICGVTDRKYTYFELYKKTEIFGATLRKKFKIKDGDVVCVMLPNSPEYPIVLLGILTAGGFVTTVNPSYTVYETQKQIISSNAKLIVTDPSNVPTVKEALKQSNLSMPIIALDFDVDRPEETISFKELINDNTLDKDVLKEVKRSAHDTSLLLYSSGTTGLPKGVELTHRNMVANCEQQYEKLIQKFDDTTASNQDIALAYLPMFHSYGISVVALQKLSAGLKLVTLPKFQPDTFINAFLKHKICCMYLAPPTVLFLASNPELSSKHFEKLKYATVGAAPLPLADVDRFLSKVGHELHFGQGYGMTEASPLVTISQNTSKRYNTVGNALPNCELKIVDSDMNALGPNELGELLVKGPNVMKGYKDNPKANSDVFVDGWLRSGDLAQIDEEGYVIIADRLKELIKVNAYQVPPAELESIIREHPEVFDAAVVGIPDDKTGEKPKAFVVLNKNSRLCDKDIIEYVNNRVAPFKRVKEVQFVDNIPKNPSGKILRRVLNEEQAK